MITEALTGCWADTLLWVGRAYASSSISTKPSFDIFVNLMKHSVMHHQHHHAYSLVIWLTWSCQSLCMCQIKLTWIDFDKALDIITSSCVALAALFSTIVVIFNHHHQVVMFDQSVTQSSNAALDRSVSAHPSTCHWTSCCDINTFIPLLRISLHHQNNKF